MNNKPSELKNHDQQKSWEHMNFWSALWKGMRQAPFLSWYFNMVDELAVIIDNAKGEDEKDLKRRFYALFHRENRDNTIAFIVFVAWIIGFDNWWIEFMMLFFASCSGIVANKKAKKIVTENKKKSGW